MRAQQTTNQWLDWRDREDDRLYARYGKALEPEHMGEFVAIGPNGECILGRDDRQLTKVALARFGPGQFAFRRVGSIAEGRICGLGG